MKKYLLTAVACVAFILAGFSQKYKTIADTAKLNQEYSQLSMDITNLNAKLADAKSKQSELQTKSGDATSDATSALNASHDQASKATNGNVKEARRERKQAKKAANASEDASDARDDLKDQDKKVLSLTKELDKKQQRLTELDEMRTSILSSPQANQ